MSRRLTESTCRFLAKHSPRRGFLAKTAVVGSALAVAPKEFIIKPGTAYAQVCRCGGSQCNCNQLCCDGYAEFCCTIYGANGCPPGSYYGGWWRVRGSNFCSGNNRYYLDCHKPCGSCGCGAGGVCSGSCNGTPCGCALGSCSNRKSGCTHFRYGQCNRQIKCLGPIICRVVTCTAPWELEETCSTSSRTDEATRNHNRACLTASPSGPIGELDLVEVSSDSLRVRGWVINPDRLGPVDVNILVNGSRLVSVQANQARPDIGVVYKSFGDNHGFDVTLAVPIGTKEVCAKAVSRDGGKNVLLGCQTVEVSATQPTGVLEQTSAAPGLIALSGWAVAPNTNDALDVDIYLDEQLIKTARANKRREDLPASIPDVGKKHGFELVIPADPGDRTVCASVNDPKTNKPIELGCITTKVIDPNEPFGAIDHVQVRTGKLRIVGWAVDPSGNTAKISILINGAGVKKIEANESRPDIATIHPNATASSGFDARLPIKSGNHQVCVYALRKNDSLGSLLGCTNVKVR